MSDKRRLIPGVIEHLRKNPKDADAWEVRELCERAQAMAVTREENLLLTDVLNRARETLLISIKGTPEELQRSLGNLNLACKAHWDWQTHHIILAEATGDFRCVAKESGEQELKCQRPCLRRECGDSR